MRTVFISNYPPELLVESRVLFSGCEVLQSTFSEKDLLDRIHAILEQRDAAQTNRVATRK